MKVLLAGGGTGGHINPALAIASIIKQHDPSAEFLFVGTPNGMEARLVPAAGYALETMHVAGFQRKLTLKNIRRNCKAVLSGNIPAPCQADLETVPAGHCHRHRRLCGRTDSPRCGAYGHSLRHSRAERIPRRYQ
ncbi:MAG: glycosyltransferase [Ruminococcus sp.]